MGWECDWGTLFERDGWVVFGVSWEMDIDTFDASMR